MGHFLDYFLQIQLLRICSFLLFTVCLWLPVFTLLRFDPGIKIAFLKSPRIPNFERRYFAASGKSVNCSIVDLEVIGHLFNCQNFIFHGINSIDKGLYIASVVEEVQ